MNCVPVRNTNYGSPLATWYL